MSFKLKKSEEGHAHLEIIKAEFDPRTGKQKFKPFMQTFTPKEYKSFLEHPNGMAIVKVHHLPDGVKTMAELKKDYENEVKRATKVNIIDLSDSVKSMFEGKDEKADPVKTVDNSGKIELKSMKNMKRDDLDNYALQFDIDSANYSNATVLKEAIQLAIDEKGLEE